jgi:hypothetical protein
MRLYFLLNLWQASSFRKAFPTAVLRHSQHYTYIQTDLCMGRLSFAFAHYLPSFPMVPFAALPSFTTMFISLRAAAAAQSAFASVCKCYVKMVVTCTDTTTTWPYIVDG